MIGFGLGFKDTNDKDNNKDKRIKTMQLHEK